VHVAIDEAALAPQVASLVCSEFNIAPLVKPKAPLSAIAQALGATKMLINNTRTANQLCAGAAKFSNMQFWARARKRLSHPAKGKKTSTQATETL